MKTKKKVFLARTLGLLFLCLPLHTQAHDLLDQINRTTDWAESIDKEIALANKEKNLISRIEQYCNTLRHVVNASDQPHELRDEYVATLRQKIELFIDREQCRLGALIQNSLDEDGQNDCDEQTLQRLTTCQGIVEHLITQYETQQSMLKTLWSYKLTKVCVAIFAAFSIKHLYNSLRSTLDNADDESSNVLTEREQKLVDHYEKEFERSLEPLNKRLIPLNNTLKDLQQKKDELADTETDTQEVDKKLDTVVEQIHSIYKLVNKALQDFSGKCKRNLSNKKFQAMMSDFLRRNPEIRRDTNKSLEHLKDKKKKKDE